MAHWLIGGMLVAIILLVAYKCGCGTKSGFSGQNVWLGTCADVSGKLGDSAARCASCDMSCFECMCEREAFSGQKVWHETRSNTCGRGDPRSPFRQKPYEIYHTGADKMIDDMESARMPTGREQYKAKRGHMIGICGCCGAYPNAPCNCTCDTCALRGAACPCCRAAPNAPCACDCTRCSLRTGRGASIGCPCCECCGAMPGERCMCTCAPCARRNLTVS